jgi:molybdopterin-guanine dinucleotide biosynthesis protein A
VLGVDMPGMTPAFLEAIVQRAMAAPDSRGVVYEGPRGFEPLAAFYPLAVLPLLQAAVAAGNLRLQAFIRSAVDAGLLEALPVPVEALGCFSNLNTPGDVAFQGGE